MLCQFCNLANGQELANVVYQTDFICCFLDINPISEGHTLIVPKKHCLDTEELDKEARLEVMNAIAVLSTAIKKLYKPDGISVMQNGGYFNDVNHYHMHVFPRYKNDGFSWVEPAQLRRTTLMQTASSLEKVIVKRDARLFLHLDGSCRCSTPPCSQAARGGGPASAPPV